jgi:hypothetical protein
MPTRYLLRTAVSAAVALALGATAARADVHSSAITVPTGTSFLTDDIDAGTQLPVSGTYTADSQSDSVDVKCYGQATMTLKSAAGSNGSFSTTGDLANIVPSAATSPHMNVCRLRAINHGSSPANLSPFAGPIVSVGRLSRGFFTSATGPNANQIHDTYFGAPQLGAADDYEGLGDCGLQDGLLVDPATLHQSNRLFFCNDWYSATDVWPGPNRSELQVDGHNAYAPSAIDGNFDHVDLSLSTGYPHFSFGPTRDATNGNTTINESDDLGLCAGDPYPPSTASCPTLAGSGVSVQRMITQDHDGRYIRIVDRFVSTDGAAHTLDALVENDFLEATTGYQFPWVDSTFHQHSATDALPGAPSAPGSIYVKGDIGAADGDTTHPQGAITFSSAPDSVRFTSPTVSMMGYHRTVPATGALTLSFTYSMGSQVADVDALAHAAEDQSGSPMVTISNPVNGSTVGSSGLNLRGFATDIGGGVTALNVNGTPVPLGAGGAWSLPIKLPPGTSTFTATATDAYSNTGSAAVQVTYAQCVVPNVHHQKLSSARKHLATAHCAAKVRLRYSSKIKKWHVITQGLKKGSVQTLGRHVTLKVSKGRRPRHRHGGRALQL